MTTTPAVKCLTPGYEISDLNEFIDAMLHPDTNPGGQYRVDVHLTIDGGAVPGTITSIKQSPEGHKVVTVQYLADGAQNPTAVFVAFYPHFKGDEWAAREFEAACDKKPVTV